MADFNAQQLADITPEKSVLEAIEAQSLFENPDIVSGPVTYYKFQASCTTSPSGYITWVNTTGDDSGKPVCGGTEGDTVLVRTWQA